MDVPCCQPPAAAPLAPVRKGVGWHRFRPCTSPAMMVAGGILGGANYNPFVNEAAIVFRRLRLAGVQSVRQPDHGCKFCFFSHFSHTTSLLLNGLPRHTDKTDDPLLRAQCGQSAGTNYTAVRRRIPDRIQLQRCDCLNLQRKWRIACCCGELAYCSLAVSGLIIHFS